jgi:proline dehydrogenase
LGLLTILAKRFIVGESKEDAVRAVRDLNALGMKTSLDILGENVTSEQMAADLADKYIDVLETIDHENITANVSVKLTQMGLDISDDFCFDNVSRIIEAARDFRWADRYDNVGTVIQSMLYRSADDIAKLIRRGIRVRLCKGAYKEPASVAFQKKDDVNANFVTLMKTLLDDGAFHSIATHDNAMIEAAKKPFRPGEAGAGRLRDAGLCALRHPLVPLLLPPPPGAQREYPLYIEASV